MCTAITYQTRDHYFGRNLDVPASYGESVVVTPRNFPLPFRRMPALERHYALLGVALTARNYPLYYDAVNEAGLAMAGLNFPGNADYKPEVPGQDNVTPFELIPWLLGRCASLAEARAALERLSLVRIPFSPDLPLAPLHWLLADRTGAAIVVECVAEGLRIYDNPVGVLTNNPPFPFHREHLAHFLNLTRETPASRFAPGVELRPCSLGLGAFGLPGDLSSASRFVRAAFVKGNAVSGGSEAESVHQFFHILDAVAQPRGCAVAGDAGYEHTVYASCCNLERGLYYYTTYENRQITCVDLRREQLDHDQLAVYPMLHRPQIVLQNGPGGPQMRKFSQPS